MRIKVWGARGSIPAPLKPADVEKKICQAIYGMPEIDTGDMEAIRAYVHSLPLLRRSTAGGNTSCVEIQAAGETFIVDAGSGLRELGLELMRGPCGQGQGRLHLFISHPHWDHIQGFPFFVPAFIAGNQIRIYSIHDLETALIDQQRFLNFPVPLSYMQARLEFVRLKVGEPFTVGPLRVNTIENAHPGVAYGYRFEDQHSTFVYANDAEYQDLDGASLQPVIDFFKDADALVFDAQYTLKEAWQKVDWGHSSAMIGVDLARAAGVKKLLLFHHDPTYSDAQLQEIQARAEAYQAEDKTRPLCDIIIAYEGLTLDLTPPGTVDLQMIADGEAAVLSPTSIFDERGVGLLGQKLERLVELESVDHSIIDLSQVETLTTASLKSLVALHRGQNETQIILANPSPSALKVIELSEYSDLFAIYPSVEAARAALQAREALNLPGHVLNERYQIIDRIGEGRLGTVLKATDLRLGRTVAIKILSPTFSEQTIARFLQQTQQIIGLDHRHIVDVFAVAVDGAVSFIVEEFTTGQTLQARLSHRQTPLPFEQVVDIALDITFALEYAHSRGAFHGDLKPQNIFLTAQGVKLSDFGLGHLEEGRKLLEAPLLFLSAAYLAPEQVRGERIAAYTDLYALGVILYELFTGHLPYEGGERDIIRAHIDPDRRPRAPREHNPALSPILNHLILKLLATNPYDRYASAQTVRRILYGLSLAAGETVRQRRQLLIGRTKDLRALQSRWRAAKAGQGQLVFITGEAGIGKTSLAYRGAMRRDAPLRLIGRSQAWPQNRPYQLFADVLQVMWAQVPVEALDEETRCLCGNLTHVVPELADLLPDLPAPAPLEATPQHRRTVASFVELLERATAQRPGLLILDDLQWADEGSLAVLQGLAQRLPSLNLLVIGLYQDDLLPRNPRLGQLLAGLKDSPGYQLLQLRRLSQRGVARVLSNIWHQAVPAAFSAMIYRHTRGNPLYVEELARSFVDDGLISWRDGAWQFPAVDAVRLPENVYEAVWRRTRHLSPDAQALLRRAATLGTTFRFEDLAALTDLSPEQVFEHLDMALEHQLIEEASAREALRFRHDVIQSIIYEDLDPIRRRQLSRLAGRRLEQQLSRQEAKSQAHRLAHHFQEAAELDKALDYSLQAGDYARANDAHEAALFWYHNALKLLQQQDTERQAELYARLNQKIAEIQAGLAG